jgi:hypothetical protein
MTGAIRIGKWRNANNDELRGQSRNGDYVSWVREQAPHHIRLENVRVHADGHVALYVGPGVTNVTIVDSYFGGNSGTGPIVYIGAESSRVGLLRSTVDGAQAGREAMAIDASDFFVVRGSHIIGGIHTYRNCGENGVVRHTTPSDGRIVQNTFRGASVALWLSSRDGGRWYCRDDDGFPFGSSQSDLDHSRRNRVTENDFGQGHVEQGGSAAGNVIEGNTPE